MKTNFVSYEECQDFYISNGIDSVDKLRAFKKGIIPDNIPKNPNILYKEMWISWWSFFKKNDINFVTYEECKAFANLNNLNLKPEWFSFIKKNKLPNGIPRDPYKAYIGKGWESWPEFFNNNKMNFVSYSECKDFAIKNNIQSKEDWFQFIKHNGNENNTIPRDPYSFYKRKGWVSWSEFLNTSKFKQCSLIEKMLKTALINIFNVGDVLSSSFIKINNKKISVDICDPDNKIAIEYDGCLWHKNLKNKERDLIKNKLLESNGWILIRIRESPLDKINEDLDFSIEKNLPYSNFETFIRLFMEHLLVVFNNDLIISNKIKTFLSLDFNYNDFRVLLNEHHKHKFISYEECKNFALKHNVKSQRDWQKLMKTHKEDYIPSDPAIIYRSIGWIDWFSFLGKEKPKIK